jgi:hypothetical protein
MVDFYSAYNQILIDVYALHGKEAALHAAKHHAEEFLNSVTECTLTDRRDAIEAECRARKKEGD